MAAHDGTGRVGLLGARRRRFGVDEYHRMVEAGILRHEENLELIEGVLMEKNPVGKRLFTVEEYHRMVEAGILHEDDRAELIEGEILEMAAVGSRHAACVKRLNKLLVPRVGGSGVVGVQDPVLLPDDSEPEPDVTILRPREDFYAEAHPTPGDVLLLIEVSDTSLEYDREVKVPLYAWAGILEVWVVDLVNERVHVYSQPTDGAYEDVRSLGRGDSIIPSAFPGFVVSIEDVLGQAEWRRATHSRTDEERTPALTQREARE